MLIVLSSARATARGKQDLVERARHIAVEARADDGCLEFGFYEDLEDSARLVAVEVWRDQASLDAHMQHEHTRSFLSAVPALVEAEPTVAIHQIADPGRPRTSRSTA